MLGPLKRFRVPSTKKTGLQITISPGNVIRLDPSKIPDYVYGEHGSGYGAMFSAQKLGYTWGAVLPV